MNQDARLFIGNELLNELTQLTSNQFSNCFVLADENTLACCYPVIQSKLPAHQVIKIESGESNKTLFTCEFIWHHLTQVNADRKSVLINLGGGVIGDMGGFAATCYKRGIAFINIPTTLLAMVDASTGGKTGVDFMGFKNQLGLFSEPLAIFIAPTFLQTLPQRELLSGFAEVIKHYLIADKSAFEQIQKSNIPIAGLEWQQAVTRNIEIKTAIVTQDPYEMGIRKALNFGHTVGHAIETHFLFRPNSKLLHGEAVAIGIITESFISLKRGFITHEELNRIALLILRYYKLPAIAPNVLPEILRLIKQDKKNERGSTQFTLLQGIGNYSINNAVEEELISESLNYYNSLLK